MKTPSLLTSRKNSGLTLIELLTVIAILAILATILIPSLRGIRTRSLQTKSVANIKQLHLGVSMYANENNNMYPRQRAISEAGEGWKGPYWTDDIRQYVVSTDRTLSSRFKDLLPFFCPLETNSHPNFSDYGNNPYIIQGRNDLASIHREEVLYPSKQVLFASTREHGNNRGGWYIRRDYATAPGDSGNAPSDRGTGTIIAVFADGHASVLPKSDFEENAKELFTGTP